MPATGVAGFILGNSIPNAAPAKSFPSLAYAVTTLFWRTMCAIYSSVRLPLSKVSIVSKQPLTGNFYCWPQKSLIPRSTLKPYETLSMPSKCYRRNRWSARFPVERFEWLHKYPAPIRTHRWESPQLHVLLGCSLYALEILFCLICFV